MHNPLKMETGAPTNEINSFIIANNNYELSVFNVSSFDKENCNIDWQNL
jgi:hypothetical protein